MRRPARLTVPVVPLLLLLPAIAGTGGCGRHEPSRVELQLYCGAGIRPAAEALIAAFERKNPGIEVKATYAGSARLLGQIAAIRKGDIFMPGAEFYVDTAVEKGLADGSTKKIAAYFIPVIFVRKGNPKRISTLEDLCRPGVRVGLGEERACAVGKKTVKILEKNGIPYEKMMKNVVLKTGTVNELGVAVQLGNVDAVVVWDVTARNFASSGDIVPIPPARNVISRIPVVVLTCSAHPAAARRFAAFVTSAEGKKLLAAEKYTVSPPPGP